MDGKWRNVVSIGCVLANESFSLLNPSSGVIDINLAHVVTILYPRLPTTRSMLTHMP